MVPDPATVNDADAGVTTEAAEGCVLMDTGVLMVTEPEFTLPEDQQVPSYVNA